AHDPRRRLRVRHTHTHAHTHTHTHRPVDLPLACETTNQLSPFSAKLLTTRLILHTSNTQTTPPPTHTHTHTPHLSSPLACLSEFLSLSITHTGQRRGEMVCVCVCVCL